MYPKLISGATGGSGMPLSRFRCTFLSMEMSPTTKSPLNSGASNGGAAEVMLASMGSTISGGLAPAKQEAQLFPSMCQTSVSSTSIETCFLENAPMQRECYLTRLNVTPKHIYICIHEQNTILMPHMARNPWQDVQRCSSGCGCTATLSPLNAHWPMHPSPHTYSLPQSNTL
jgi:hypothetical protein